MEPTTVIIMVVAGVLLLGSLIFNSSQHNRLRAREQELRLLTKQNDTLALEAESQTTQLAEKVQRIGGLEAQVRDREQELQARNLDIAQLKVNIADMARELAEKERDLVESRLEKLNYELSPHAFKNTLNMIQSMALRMNMATEKLTDLLNYMLYDTKNKRVSLAEELTFIDQYIALNDLMTPPWVNIEKNFGEIDEQFARRMSIAPLITIYFAENAFKHARQDGKDCFIKFSIRKVNDNQVVYTVTNKRFLNQKPKPRSGVGSTNLQQRLDLMYPDKYTLESHPLDELYIATLTLTLEPYENTVPAGG